MLFCDCQLSSHNRHVTSILLHFIALYGLILQNPECWEIAQWRGIYNRQAFSQFSIHCKEYCVNSLFQILINLKELRNVLKIISDLLFLYTYIIFMNWEWRVVEEGKGEMELPRQQSNIVQHNTHLCINLLQFLLLLFLCVCVASHK